MRLHALRSVELVAVACLFSPLSSAHGNDNTADELVASFFAEAPVKWEEYRAHSKTIKGKVKAQVKITKTVGGTSMSNWEDEITQNRNGSVIVRNLSSRSALPGKKWRETTKMEAFGQNSQYSFRLLKKNSDWLLEVVNRKPETRVTEARGPLAEVAFRELSPHFFILGEPLWDFIKKPTKDRVSFVKGAMVESGDRNLIRLEAKHKETGETGWFLFDQDNFWCLAEYELRTEKADIVDATSVKHEFERLQNLPIIKRYTFTVEYKEPGKTHLREGLHEFDLRVVHDIPDLEFTMSAFGLPEPFGIVWPKPTRWWLWITLAACATFVVGIGVVLFRQRSRNPEPVKT